MDRKFQQLFLLLSTLTVHGVKIIVGVAAIAGSGEIEVSVIADRVRGPFFVIGDIHGYVEALGSLLDNARRCVPNFDDYWLVFVGDLVDRGENPRAAVDFVIDLMEKRGKTTCIMGNHEFALLSALGMLGKSLKAEFAEPYVEIYSPDPTFLSYGVEPGDLPGLRSAIPERHMELILSLPWCVEADGHLMVHAGLLPDVAYEEQLEKLRRREMNPGQPWLHAQRLVTAQPPPDCPVTVVSGHVRFPQVVFSEKRILVDTTGGRSGLMSGVLLPERRIVKSSVPI
jgi:serine/threonine protein phosphatase 1